MSLVHDIYDASPSSPAISAKFAAIPAKGRLDAMAFYDALSAAVSDASDMQTLLDLALEIVVDLNAPAEINHKVDRIITLLNISRGLSEKISQNTWPDQPFEH